MYASVQTLDFFAATNTCSFPGDNVAVFIHRFRTDTGEVSVRFRCFCDGRRYVR